MTKRLRVIAIVIGLLAMLSGSVSAYSKENLSVTIIEGKNEFSTNLTEPITVKQLLELQGITVSEDDELNYALDYTVQSGDTVKIKHSIPVIIEYDDIPHHFPYRRRTSRQRSR